MVQFDLEKLEKALIYVERIADGKNPVNNTQAYLLRGIPLLSPAQVLV